MYLSNSKRFLFIAIPKTGCSSILYALSSDKTINDKSSNANTNEYFLVCKGADSIMLDLCDINQTDRFNTTKEIDAFARKGLRTLCVTRKSLTEGQVNEWLNKYNSVKASIEDHDAKVDAVAAEIERDLELLGVTALEDRLQTGVPELINDFLDVGITVWMLTGDKGETA